MPQTAARTAARRPEWRGGFTRSRALPFLALYALLFAAVALLHATLLHLPYFWDEGGYYVPAALDFYHRWTLIPEFTNAHPPLPNVVLGLLWHVFGFHILVTRLTACAFAAGGLLAVFVLGRKLLGTPTGIALTLLTLVYPIWFVQSSLAHADIFAAAFTLAGLSIFLTAPEQNRPEANAPSSPRRLGFGALFFCLSVLAKETAVVQPLVLALVSLAAALGANGSANPEPRRAHLRWAAILCTPVPVLAAWFGYHRWKTGFTFGNPEYLRYNATANFTAAHIAKALQFRFLHLAWQRNIWVPLLLAGACLVLPPRSESPTRSLPRLVVGSILALIAANWLAFSVLGGALLTRYLLPIYPLLLLLCVWVWMTRTAHWPWLAAITGAAFVSALWLNPPTYFAPEDNLTYRDLIVVHQEAIAYLQQHYPDATVLTAWPAASELFRPELGYTQHRFKVFSIDNFSAAELAKAAQQPGRFDTALVFTTHYTAPLFRHYLLTHPDSTRGREYLEQRDLSPAEIARLLHGRIMWQDDRNGEWAAVLRFDRSYDALLYDPSGSGPSKRRHSALLCEPGPSPACEASASAF